MEPMEMRNGGNQVVYPLKFQPVFQKRLWGGQRLRTILGKSLPRGLEKEPVGESWELADLQPGTVKADSTGAAADGSLSSVIANGPLAGTTLHEVWREIKGGIRKTKGEREKARDDTYFPLLVKFLDAQQDLSVQVHPDEAFCGKNPGSHLKSETWYVLHAEPGAKIYKGLKPGVTREQFREALRAGQVEPLLNAVRVRTGDCHYLPSGTVHALGAGIVAAEVQTPSDTTFRVFDWNRLTPEGKPRQLHVEQALECISFENAQPEIPVRSQARHPEGTRLVECEYFTLDRIRMEQGAESALDARQVLIWIVLEGQAVITCDAPGPAASTAMARGDTVLLPANMRGAKVKTISTCTLLEAGLPGSMA
jgi:mannose-6-phosphate isomerase